MHRLLQMNIVAIDHPDSQFFIILWHFLLPCNDLVFYPLKKALRGLWFGSGRDIKVTMVQCFLQQPMEFFWKGSIGWCVNETTSLVPMGIAFNRLYSFAEISPHKILIWTYLMSVCEVVEVLGETGVILV